MRKEEIRQWLIHILSYSLIVVASVIMLSVVLAIIATFFIVATNVYNVIYFLLANSISYFADNFVVIGSSFFITSLLCLGIITVIDTIKMKKEYNDNLKELRELREFKKALIYNNII